MKVLSLFFCSFFLIACNAQKELELCSGKSVLNATVSGASLLKLTEEDSFFYYLNSSNVSKAKEFIPDLNYNESYNGFRYYTYKEKSQKDQYKLFRLNEFVGDIDQNTLSTILGRAYNEAPDTCFELLLEAEHSYLTCIRKIERKASPGCLNDFKQQAKPFNRYERIRYLTARLDYYNGNYAAALPELSRLLNTHYYEKPVLKVLIDHFFFKQKNVDSLRHYSGIFSRRFPDECNAGILYLNDASSEISFTENCKRCLASNQKDSILGRLYYARERLNAKDYRFAESAYKEYENSNQAFIQDSLKIWERGQYFEIALKAMFAQKKFEQFLSFLTEKVGMNNNVILNNEADLFNLIRDYYKYYFNSNASDQELRDFFQKHFSSKKLLKN